MRVGAQELCDLLVGVLDQVTHLLVDHVARLGIDLAVTYSRGVRGSGRLR